MHHKGTTTRSVHRSGPMIRERAEPAVSNRGSRIQRFGLAATKAGRGLRNLCRVGQTETGVGRTGKRASTLVEWLVTEARRLADAGPEGY